MGKIHLRRLTHLDAAESLFFLRELAQVKRKSYDKVYPELKARKFIPASEEPAGPADETIIYRQYDHVGMVKMIASYADDLPRVDVLGREFSSPVRALGCSFGYNLQEVRASAKTGRSIPQMRANAARKVTEEQIDALLAIGDADTGIPGFLTAASVPATSVATVAGDTTWAEKAASDPDLIVDDVTDAIVDMVALTHGREYPDTCLMPEAQFALISTTRLVDQPITVLDFLKKAFPRITTWEAWYRLDGAGAAATDRFMLYKKDPEKCFSEVPQEFEALDVQPRNLEYVTPCHARVGGTIFPFPLSATFRDGI